MKYGDLNSLITRVLVLIILILYALFLYLDFYDANFFITSLALKYSSIILCFLLAIFSAKSSMIGLRINKDSNEHNVSNINIVKNRNRLLLQWGMFITVIADLCLVVLNYYILGIIFFSMVQIIYSVRYTAERLNATLINFFIVFQFIIFSYLIVSIFIKEINILIPVSLFYSICLLTSVNKAIKAFNSNLYPSPNKYMIVFGMILFLLCDICVAISNITETLPSTADFIMRFQLVASFLIWVFYLPSQLLLALSGSCETKGL